jgi:hypothetical protein
MRYGIGPHLQRSYICLRHQYAHVDTLKSTYNASVACALASLAWCLAGMGFRGSDLLLALKHAIRGWGACYLLVIRLWNYLWRCLWERSPPLVASLFGSDDGRRTGLFSHNSPMTYSGRSAR